jgi:hypothetical protein
MGGEPELHPQALGRDRRALVSVEPAEMARFRGVVSVCFRSQEDCGPPGKSFEILRPGGHILIHEMFYNDEKTGPFPVAAFSIIMLGWTEGEQYSGEGDIGDAA